MKPFFLLVADDDEDDWEFIGSALEQIGANQVTFVRDGQELLDYLRREGVHAGRDDREKPDLVILDLKMPKLTGAEVLSEIRGDPDLMRMPVVVLTTSTSEHEVNDSYERGANTVISKPASFVALVDVLRSVSSYWSSVRLPTDAPKLERWLGIGDIPRTGEPVTPPPEPVRPVRRRRWSRGPRG